MTATQPQSSIMTEQQSPIETEAQQSPIETEAQQSLIETVAQQSPIETVVTTTTSANQSLCQVDSDADTLQNTYSNGKLEKHATGML